MKSSLSAFLAVGSLLAGGASLHAADSTWISAPNGAWSNAANWSNGVPGATSGNTSTDTATFTSASTVSPFITVDANRNIGSITFGTTAGVNNYLFTGGGLLPTAGGTIQADSSFAGVAGFSTGLVLQGNATLSANGAQGSGFNFNTINTTTSGNVLTLTGSNAGVFNTVVGIISGSGSLSKTGGGTWVLGTANTFTGGTTLNGGTLIVQNATALGTAGAITIAGSSTLRTNTALTDASARISIGDGATLTFDTNNQAQTWAGLLGNSGGSNTAGLTKTGLGGLTITPANGVVQTYRGPTTVNMGTLTISGASQTAGFSNLINANSALVLNGGNIGFTGKAGFINSQAFNGTTLNAGISQFIPAASSGTNTFDFGVITRNAGSLLNITTAGGYTFNATGTTNDAGGLVKGVFSGNDFYRIASGSTLGVASYTTQSVATNWTDSTLNYSTASSVSGVVGSGGTTTINSLRLNNASSQSFTINGTLALNDGLLFTSTIGANPATISEGNLTSGSGDLIIVNNNAQAVFGRNTITSTIVDNGSPTNVVLYSSATNGMIYLGGNNSYTGNTYIGGGSNAATGTTGVTVGGAADASIGSSGATVYVNGGTGGATSALRVGNGDATGDVKGTIQVDNGNLILNRTDTGTLSATVRGGAGGGLITLGNTGNTTVNFGSGSNTFQSLASTAAGTLNLNGAGSVNTFISTAPFNGGFNAGSNVNFNSGTYIFNATGNTGANRTGLWNVQGATVQILGGRYFNSGGGTVAVSAGTVRFGGDRITAGEQQSSGTAINFNVSGTGLLDVPAGSTSGFNVGSGGAPSQTNTSSVVVNQTGGTTQVGVNAPLANPGSATQTNLVIGNGATMVQAAYNLSGGTLRVAGTISGAALGAAQTGNLSFTIGSNVAVLTVNTNHYAGEVLSGANAIAAGVDGATILSISGQNVTLSTNATATVAGASVTGNQQQGNLNRSFNWTGGTLTAGGFNAANLGGNNGVTSIAGNTTSGTLLQGGITSVMAPGDTFGGVTYTGRTAITGNYRIDAGTVAIGLGGTTAATAFHSNSIGTFDNISVTGTTTLGGLLDVNFLNNFASSIVLGNSFTILTSTGGLSGTFANAATAYRVENINGNNYDFVLAYNPTNVVLTLDAISPVPEPSPFALALLALPGLLFLLHRRRVRP